MAENVLSSYLKDSPKPRRGRGLTIDDGRLWGVRDHLVWLLESTWADMGGELSRIRTPADVVAALRVWTDKSTEHVTKALLRPSSSPATSPLLNQTRHRLEELDEKVRSAHEFVQKCSESFERAFHIPTEHMSQGEQTVIDDQVRKRVAVLAHAAKEYLELKNQQEDMEERLKDGEAYFARSEVVDFCRSKRYRLKPLKVANAMAGLPMIGWRQSAKRCAKRPCPGLNGISIQVFETIRLMINTCARRSDLVRHAEQWLRTRLGTKSVVVRQLQQDWFYLRWAIKTVLEAGSRQRDLPYAISREYWKRKREPSSTDRLFEEEERIQ